MRGRLPELAVGAVVGLELGLLGCFASEWTTRGWWTGAVGVALADVVAGLLLARTRRGRAPVGAALAGWLLPVAYFSSGQAKGDVVVRAAPHGYGFLLLGAAGFLPGAWAAARALRSADGVPATPAGPSRR